MLSLLAIAGAVYGSLWVSITRDLATPANEVCCGKKVYYVRAEPDNTRSLDILTRWRGQQMAWLSGRTF